MVRVTFKLTEVGRVELDLPTPLLFREVLQHCVTRTGYTPGGYIAVRKGKVVSAGDMIEDGDEIDIFPALSGG
ncbi:MAG: MoaD/ThiS family protein [Proteobacteria bacterium]|nr:MoaD/ThiS family protein [Pseudomonadota bacterium]